MKRNFVNTRQNQRKKKKIYVVNHSFARSFCLEHGFISLLYVNDRGLITIVYASSVHRKWMIVATPLIICIVEFIMIRFILTSIFGPMRFTKCVFCVIFFRFFRFCSFGKFFNDCNHSNWLVDSVELKQMRHFQAIIKMFRNSIP